MPPFGEDLVPGDPVDRLVEDLARVGLEDDALARPPAPRVHHGVEALGELVLVVVRVELGPQIDVALRPLAARGNSAGCPRDRASPLIIGGDHEGRVDDLAEAELLGEVVRAAEQRRRRALAVDQQLQAAEQHAVVEGELDLVGAAGTARAPGSSSSGCPTGSRPRSARRPGRPACGCGESAGTKMPAGATE